MLAFQGVAHAQGKSKLITSTLKAATEKSVSGFSKGSLETVLPKMSPAASLPGTLRSKSAVPAITENAIWEKLQELQQEVNSLRKANIELKASAVTNAIPSDAYIFQARETDDMNQHSNLFSGAVFSIDYQGKKEVYGVIATHAIAGDTMEKYSLHKTFTAIIYKNGLQKLVPVEVVAVSPQSMLDVALVKFPAEIEPLLLPYRLGTITDEISLISKGFSGPVPTAVSNREIIACTPLSIRTTMPLERMARPGLCGSAVLNSKNELVGIHTGSLYSTAGETADIAYATPAYYLKNLVEAYHNPGKGTFPFMLNGQKIADFAIEEYITHLSLLDAEKHMLWQLQVPFKLPYSKLQEALENYPQAKFLQLTTRHASWTEDGYAFVENRTKADRNKKTTYTYDLQEQKLLTAFQSVYNPTLRQRKTIKIYPQL